jgi:hypothetical protein
MDYGLGPLMADIVLLMSVLRDNPHEADLEVKIEVD